MSSVQSHLVVDAPVVSIVIPAFNAASTIAQAVHSCLQQTLASIEVLVIDDASSDATAALAQQAAQGDVRVVVERLAINGGPSAARNRAIELARGRWIALLDADDCFVPQRLAVMVVYAEKVQADLLADNIEISYPEVDKPNVRQFDARWMAEAAPLTAAALAAQDRPYRGRSSAGYSKPLLRREFLLREGIRYRPELRIGEDFHLYLHSILKGARFLRLDEALYSYRYDPQSLSRGAESKQTAQLLAGNEELLAIAQAVGDIEGARELRKRGAQLEHWVEYLALKQALQRRSLKASLSVLRRMSSRSFAVNLLLRAALRRCLPAYSLS